MGVTNGKQFVKKPLKRWWNVKGAPFRIGDRVEVVDAVDETLSRRYVGKKGVVEYFEYDCGCGQSFPDDPMIGVRFSMKKLPQEFWKEELKKS